MEPVSTWLRPQAPLLSRLTNLTKTLILYTSIEESAVITADRLKTLTSFTPKALAMGLAQSGYTGVSFETAEFVGITNGGQFCYKVT